MKPEDKFLKAYDEYGAAILRHISFRVASRREAEDIFQETFFRAWRALRNGEQVENLKAYIYMIARNLIIDHYRKNNNKEVSIEDLGYREPSTNEMKERVGNKVDADRVLDRLRELDPDEREAIYLKYVDGLKAEEIGKILGKTPNNIRVIIHRGLKELRKKYV